MEFESGNKKPAVFAETLNIITHFNTLLLLLTLAGKANTEVFVLPAMTGVVWCGVVESGHCSSTGSQGWSLTGVSVGFFPNISPL